ncbi:GNAT family protein [Azotosporobacter soli]|uniref:GNAT family N-acetyltransferase n=1 Tax=Azotosporobacter soli TaxID=3055040 RepID=UPI0031FEF008
MELRVMTVEWAEELVCLLRENKDRFCPVEPLRPEEYYTAEFHRLWLEKNGENTSEIAFGLFEAGRLSGQIKLSVIQRGASQSAAMGYWVDRASEGRGCCSWMVSETLRYARDKLGLHRVWASVLPENKASQRVLEKNGFSRFGLSRDHLCIAGQWRDHLLYEIILPDLT